MTSVGLTGLNSVLGAPGVPVAKCLKIADRNLRLVGLESNPSSPGFFDPIFDKTKAIPPLPDEGYPDQLLSICSEEELDILMPNTDAEVARLSRYLDEFKEVGTRLLIPRYEVVSRVENKIRLELFLREEGIPHPKSEIVHVDANSSDLKLGYPLVIKSEEGAFSVMNEDELKVALRRLSLLGRKEVVAQEYIDGDEYSWAAVCLEGSVKGWVMQKKLALSDIGSTLMGISVINKPVLSIAELVVRKLKWTGPLELEFLVSEGRILLTDFNLRFPAWIYLSPFTGVNLPYLAVNIALRGDVPGPQIPKSGVIIVRSLEDRIISFRDLSKIIGEVQGLQLLNPHRQRDISWKIPSS